MCDLAIKEIGVRKRAVVATHFKIGATRRVIVERTGEESTALEQVARVCSKYEQYMELSLWANTSLASLDCVYREQFTDKLTELLACYEAVGQLAERRFRR